MIPGTMGHPIRYATVMLLALPPAVSSDRGPCPEGMIHAFDGYLGCALDAEPCAKKVIVGSAIKPVLMSDCAAACAGCIGLSLWGSTECWVYSSWPLAAQHRVDEQSVICRKSEPLPPPPPFPPPQPPPPPVFPPPSPPQPRQKVALNYLKAAGWAMVEGIPPAVLLAAASGLVLLVVVVLGCLCLCWCPCGSCCASHNDDLGDLEESDESDFDDEGNFGIDDEGEDESSVGGRPAFHRVLIEVDGAVITSVSVRTAGCLSLRGLRRRVSKACAEYTGGRPNESGLVLEYLDEAAGVAVLVSDERELQVALCMSTLKATFGGLGAPRAGAAPRAPRAGGRKRGYVRGCRSEEDAEAADVYGDDVDDYEPRARGCLVQ